MNGFHLLIVKCGKTEIQNKYHQECCIFIYKNAHHGFNRKLHKKLVRFTEKSHDYVGRASQYNEEADKELENKNDRVL